MLKSNQAALQVFKAGTWRYVFCYSQNMGDIVTTPNRKKALNASLDMQWFQSKFGNDLFKAEAR